MLTDVSEIMVYELQNQVAAIHQQGYRFVTMTCLDRGETHEILYHFDKQYQMKHLRVQFRKGAPVPSISSQYFAAVLIENEIKDMFGVNFTGLAIDYQGKFLLAEDAPKTPLNKTVPGVSVQIQAKPAGGEKPA
jgi:ech hydrogenase subunit D